MLWLDEWFELLNWEFFFGDVVDFFDECEVLWEKSDFYGWEVV